MNKKIRESLNVALVTIFDEYIYLDDALKGNLPASLKERFIKKRDDLKRAGEWIESKLTPKGE